METKQVIVIRKDLKMRKGKMVSQGAHASLKAYLSIYSSWGLNTYGTDINRLSYNNIEELYSWMNDGLSTKITCGVDSLEELEELYNQAEDAKLPCAIITDMGLTEFKGNPTVTAIAIGPATSEKIDNITNNLKLL